MAIDIQSRLLRRTESAEQYQIYLAGLEWDLIDPIIIEGQKDFKSEPRWRDTLTPFHHQVKNLITYCRRLPVTLLADDVGLGKTISAGLIMSELMSRSRLTKTLIVCPKLLGPQWKEELTTKFDIPSIEAMGKSLLVADPGDGGAVITTYNSARLYLKSIPEDRFQMLVLDEAHKLRNLYGVPKPPQVASMFSDVLQARRFRYVLMLTATPIHNRLWDLYSLVDLLTVARGHKNPFGSEGAFARKFIADDKEKARHLRAETQEEFRSIVYGYMSRVRRGDAKLHFPERVVLMHKMEPTPAELALIKVVGSFIAKLNRLAQISILQALASSPDALRAQLDKMELNRTIPADFAPQVRRIVATMPSSAKLTGLGVLVDKLQRERPDRWRVVVFTGRIQTQTTIQIFLERRGLKVGIINGSSGARNQDTLAQFRKTPPAYHIIVSTEAGSEGINLQVANVLVNFDLPWNPMIVEQRIGRVQRLASEHANVSIYNVMLKGTFEEYIVGRLMEKLQMASHAIGEVDSLLEAIDASADEDEGAGGFEERIRQLVVAALEGKDVAAEVEKTQQSIQNAKDMLQAERQTIDETLGRGEGQEYVGPRPPRLHKPSPILSPEDFTVGALRDLGATVTRQAEGLYLSQMDGGREMIRFKDPAPEDRLTVLYAPGTPPFQKLVDGVIASGIHDVEDIDQSSSEQVESLTHQWVDSFGGTPTDIDVTGVRRGFDGKATIRARVTVAHDSYERLVSVQCRASDTYVATDRAGLARLRAVIETAADLGIVPDRVLDHVQMEPSISDFSRFYKERRDQELLGAVGDDRKRKKLEDDFTPRLEMTFVAAEGKVSRRVKVIAHYTLDSAFIYTSLLTVIPHTGQIADVPSMAVCAKTGRKVPGTCVKQCEGSRTAVLEELLVRSEGSGRLALREYTTRCSATGKRLLKDEVETSWVTGRPVDRSHLRTSAITGRWAEPEHFGRCHFTSVEALKSELVASEVSGKPYRVDEKVSSAVSGKSGHKQEFLKCAASGNWLLSTEAERCAVTGKQVIPGILETCDVSGKRALGSELGRCAVTGRKALKKLLVRSSISDVIILELSSVRSTSGQFCTPAESTRCDWSGRACHPDDVRVCALTGLQLHSDFVTTGGLPRLEPLVELLDGRKHAADESTLWHEIDGKVATAGVKGKINVNAARRSPDGKRVAATAEVKTLLGLKVLWAGCVYSRVESNIVGRIVLGRRVASEWTAQKN
jgi:superfamily II DNA or RNA helicase